MPFLLSKLRRRRATASAPADEDRSLVAAFNEARTEADLKRVAAVLRLRS